MKVYFLFVSIFVSYCAFGQMQLNNAFGNSGFVTYHVAQYNNPVAMLQQTDSSLLLLANVSEVDTELHTSIVIIKTNNRGYIDSTFAGNGVVNLQFNGMHNCTANAMVQLSDNSIVVLGTGTSDSNSLFKPACLLKLNSNGTIDSSFKNSGTMYLQFSGIEEYPRVLKVNSNDELLIGGFSTDTNDLHSDVPVIAKLDAAGMLDSAFGVNGKMYIHFPNGYVTASRHLIGGVLYDILPLQDGSMLAAGGYSDINNLISFITRIKYDGNIDTAFVDTGYLAIDFTPLANSQVVKLAQAPNGLVWFGAISGSEQTRDFYVGNINLATNDYNTAAIDFSNTQDDVADININEQGDLFVTGRCALPQHNFNWYRSDFFAVNYAPIVGFPFNNQRFTYTSDSVLQTGCVASLISHNGTLLLYGFKYTANGSDLMLLGMDVDNITSVPDVKPGNSAVHIYPNPASNGVFINGVYANSEITIIDISGRVIMATKSSTDFYMPVDRLPSGVYILSVHSASVTTNTKLVVR